MRVRSSSSSVSKARGRWGRGLLAAGSMLLLLAAVGPTAARSESVYGSGLFELGDGQPPPGAAGLADVLGASEQPGPDWQDLFDAEGRPRDDYPYDAQGNPVGNGVPDYRELYGGLWARFESDDVSMGSGFEGSALYPDGRVYNSTVPADDDIGNAYVYSTLDATGNVVLYVGAERLGDGDSYLEFEFDQDHLRLGRGGYGVGMPWEIQGERRVGDLRAKVWFAGGALSSASVAVWDGEAWIGFASLDGEGCDGSESFCAVLNASPVDGGPWTNFDSGPDPELISAQRFVELGINVGALLGSQPAFTTVCVRTPADIAFAYLTEEG